MPPLPFASPPSSSSTSPTTTPKPNRCSSPCRQASNRRRYCPPAAVTYIPKTSQLLEWEFMDFSWRWTAFAVPLSINKFSEELTLLIPDVTTPGVGIHGFQLEMDSIRSASFNKQVFRRTNLVDPRLNGT
nr:uncharacterized protein LOC117860066 isoform X2 [Setaria viridis]